MNKLFNLFKINKKQPSSEEKEFSLIWYKRMQAGSKTHYTQPFRTKVKAKSYTEARDKLAKMVLSKMQLVITEEHEFDKSELAMVQNQFSKINDAMKEMEKAMNKVKM